MSRLFLLVALGLAPAASASEVLDLGAPVASDALPVPTERDAAAILALVNAPECDLTCLDEEVGLDRRAATSLIRTRDDRAFATLTEVDATPWVGPATMATLLAHVRRR